jgi:(p)ppGpp synthase/HD superfamily hydrolase
MNIIEKSKQYAIECHGSTGHQYDGKPYDYHLRMVYEAGLKFIHLIPEKERDNVLASCWVHDCIEDCRQTYNDVKNATNESVAELAYALTNEKGKTRKERANDKYYQGIRETPYAIFVKVCDRIANVEHSKQQGSRMIEMYSKENKNFTEKLFDEQYAEMFEYLNKCVKE